MGSKQSGKKRPWSPPTYTEEEMRARAKANRFQLETVSGVYEGFHSCGFQLNETVDENDISVTTLKSKTGNPVLSYVNIDPDAEGPSYYVFMELDSDGKLPCRIVIDGNPECCAPDWFGDYNTVDDCINDLKAMRDVAAAGEKQFGVGWRDKWRFHSEDFVSNAKKQLVEQSSIDFSEFRKDAKIMMDKQISKNPKLRLRDFPDDVVNVMNNTTNESVYDTFFHWDNSDMNSKNLDNCLLWYLPIMKELGEEIVERDHDLLVKSCHSHEDLHSSKENAVNSEFGDITEQNGASVSGPEISE